MLKNLFCLVLCFSLLSCQSEQGEENNKANTSKREVEQGLVLFNATLEQSNAAGENLWKLSTEKAVYSQDKKTAKLTKITGNLFSNGQLILQVSAKKGEIKQDGQEIYLQEDIIALDPRNKAELKGNELEWRPQEHILILRNNLTGNHAKLTVSAQEAIYHTDKQRLQLKGNIIATAKNPPLQMKTEHLFWQISQDKVIGDRPLKMTRYEQKIITDQLTTNQAEIDLKANIATIQGLIEYNSLKPPLQAATDVILWQYKDRIIEAKNPIKLIQTEDKMILTSNQANVNLETKMAYLDKGVYGEAAKDEVKIYADYLRWNIETEVIEANGNVHYQQINPDFNLTGVKAVGKLKDKNVVVSGDYENKVVTEIYPQE
jgi:LPS export ABC transporter protein LptC